MTRRPSPGAEAAPPDGVPEGAPDGGGWRRVLPVLPYLATAALFVAGLWALAHLLGEVSAEDLRGQVRAVPLSHLGGALLATAVGYGAMACYDWTALRYIGRVLPARTIALGGFLAYSIGNTIGLSALSGGAVRYRVYSVLGLGVGDIARISGFVALAYGTGATMVGLGALILWPTALGNLLPLPPGLVRGLAVAGFVIGNLLIWAPGFLRGRLRLGRRSIEAPAPGLMATQLVITLVEMLMGALVLRLLLPGAEISFVPFLAVYLAASMAGILSHVPGGVGVFETLVIAALPGSVGAADAAAALLLYRLIYYILPFVLALALLALAEARQWLTGRLTAALRALTLALVPLAMGVMVMGAGAIMVLALMVPPSSPLADDAEAALRVLFSETGALLSSALGAMLVVIAQGLLRRLAGAWWLTMIALLAGIAAALLDDYDSARALVLAGAALLLLPCRGAFWRPTRLTTRALSPGWLALVAGLVISVLAMLWLALHAAAPWADEVPWQFADDARVPRGLRVGLALCVALVLVMLWQALRRAPAIAASDDALRARVAAILARWGQGRDALALAGGKAFLLSEAGDAFIAYAEQGRLWVALGDPVGDPAQVPGLIWAFRDAARRARAIPVFYEASPRWFPQWIETGMVLHKLGEAAGIDLTAFSLQGPGRKRLRASHAHALREGLRFRLLPAGGADALLGGLRAVSDRWLASRMGREKAFSVGRFDPDWLRRFPVAVVWQGEAIVGFALILVDARGASAAIDLMRHDPDTPLPVMEFLFVETMLALQAQGFARLDLGVAPLAGLEEARDLAGRLGRLVYRHGGRLYGFQGLRQFKDKFAPDWQPRYLVLPRLANPVLIVADLTRLISAPPARDRTAPR